MGEQKRLNFQRWQNGDQKFKEKTIFSKTIPSWVFKCFGLFLEKINQVSFFFNLDFNDETSFNICDKHSYGTELRNKRASEVKLLHTFSASAWRLQCSSQQGQTRETVVDWSRFPTIGAEHTYSAAWCWAKTSCWTPPTPPTPCKQEGSFPWPKGGGIIVCASPSTSRNSRHAQRQSFLNGHFPH